MPLEYKILSFSPSVSGAASLVSEQLMNTENNKNSQKIRIQLNNKVLYKMNFQLL